MSLNKSLVCLFLISYVGSAVVLFLDGWLVKQEHPYYSFGASSLMLIILLFLVMYRKVLRTRVLNGPGLFPPKYARAFNPLGVFIGLVVSLAINKNSRPPSPYMYTYLLCVPISSFSLLMIFKPVNTDFGCFYPFFGLGVGFSAGFYGNTSKQTFFALALFGVLMVLRSFFETRAVMRAFDRKEEVKRAARAACAQAIASSAAAAGAVAAARIHALNLNLGDTNAAAVAALAQAITACNDASNAAAAAAAAATAAIAAEDA